MKDENLPRWRRLQDVSNKSSSRRMLAGDLLFETYKCRNIETSLVTLLKRFCTNDTLPAILGILGSLIGNTCDGVTLSVVQVVDWTACIAQKKPYWECFPGIFYLKPSKKHNFRIYPEKCIEQTVLEAFNVWLITLLLQ